MVKQGLCRNALQEVDANVPDTRDTESSRKTPPLTVAGADLASPALRKAMHSHAASTGCILGGESLSACFTLQPSQSGTFSSHLTWYFSTENMTALMEKCFWRLRQRRHLPAHNKGPFLTQQTQGPAAGGHVQATRGPQTHTTGHAGRAVCVALGDTTSEVGAGTGASPPGIRRPGG